MRVRGPACLQTCCRVCAAVVQPEDVSKHCSCLNTSPCSCHAALTHSNKNTRICVQESARRRGTHTHASTHACTHTRARTSVHALILSSHVPAHSKAHGRVYKRAQCTCTDARTHWHAHDARNMHREHADGPLEAGWPRGGPGTGQHQPRARRHTAHTQ